MECCTFGYLESGKMHSCVGSLLLFPPLLLSIWVCFCYMRNALSRSQVNHRMRAYGELIHQLLASINLPLHEQKRNNVTRGNDDAYTLLDLSYRVLQRNQEGEHGEEEAGFASCDGFESRHCHARRIKTEEFAL